MIKISLLYNKLIIILLITLDLKNVLSLIVDIVAKKLKIILMQ